MNKAPRPGGAKANPNDPPGLARPFDRNPKKRVTATMRPQMIYLAGPPAAGKSTLMAALLALWTRTPQAQPIRHDVLHSPLSGTLAAELGGVREKFSGTDALPMNVSPKACAWVETCPYPVLFAEGDRLAHLRFLQAADRAYAVTLLVLEVPRALLDQRCEDRGSAQSGTWRNGRATKVERLAAYAESGAAGTFRVIRLNGTLAPHQLVAQVHSRVLEVPWL